MLPYRVGADPELFLASGDGKKIISAIGKFGGTKDNPIQVHGWTKGFAYQEDNVLMEYNIPAAGSCEYWVKNHRNMIDYLTTLVGQKGYSLKIQASHIMDDDQLTDLKAHVFGCDPDFNCYTLLPNPRATAKNKALRSAGGHVHIGQANMSRVDAVMLGRLMDASVGLWSVIHDTDTRRRELYGQAGSIRFKPYGMEYRTLSNFWLRHEESMQYVYAAVGEALKSLSLKHFSTINEYGSKIREVINTSDKVKAAKMLKGDWDA